MQSIKDIRLSTGLSQAQFSAALNIPKRTIQDWEQGLRKCPEYVAELIEHRVVNDPTIPKTEPPKFAAKYTYPFVLISEETGFTIDIPDFDIKTQCSNLSEATEAAKNAITIMGLAMDVRNDPIPRPSKAEDIKPDRGGIVSVVEVDFSIYRQ